MQRADYFLASNNTVRQRTSLMRAAIIHRYELIAKVEYRNLLATYLHGPALTQRNVPRIRDLMPLHVSMLSNAWICTNCVG